MIVLDILMRIGFMYLGVYSLHHIIKDINEEFM